MSCPYSSAEAGLPQVIILTVAILNNYNPPPPPRRNNKTAKKNSGKNRRVGTLWIFSSWAGCRGVIVGRGGVGGVTPPKVEKRCCCRQFANLQGNILHGRFSSTFAILRKKHISDDKYKLKRNFSMNIVQRPPCLPKCITCSKTSTCFSVEL